MTDITTKTQDEINQDLIDNMPNYQATTGFPIGDFFVAIAMVLKNLWDLVVSLFNMLNIDNLTGDDLTRKCKQDRNIIRKAATGSSGNLHVTGDFSLAVGDQFSTEGGLIFKVTAATVDTNGAASVPVQCTTTGASSNVPTNSITKMPITLQGVTSVTNTEAFTNGYDEESDDDLRQRYKDDVAMPITSGNQYHYKKWAKEIIGVGDARVIPLWNGANTVKAVIINSNAQAANADLIKSVQDYIDPDITGTGAGQAPIGAYCTVVSATGLNINITAKIKYKNGYDKATTNSAIDASFVIYLKSIAFKQNYVSYAKIGDLILSADGVEDYSDLKVNSGITNIVLTDEQVAIKGTTTYTEVS